MKKQPLALLIAALFLPSAFAATTDEQLPETRVTAKRVRAGSPNDVVITGSKTDTALKDLPASVVVVPAETLRQQGVLDMNRAMDNASGVQPVLAGGYGFANNYAIRGLPMRFLRDGYPDGTSQNGYWRTMYDVDRIEILKGPGSALYGSGQPGGSVNVVTKQPRKGFGAEVGMLGGSFGTWGTYADVWGSVGQNVAARLIADVERSDGYRGLSRDIKEISPSFAWAIDADKTLTFDFDHRDIKVKPDNYGILFDNRGNIANVARDARYYSPMNTTEQTIDRLTVAHEWRFNPDLTMRTALIQDQRSLHLLRNGGGNGGNTITSPSCLTQNQSCSRQIRDQVDDARYTTLQNEVVWKLKSGNIAHTLLGGIEYNVNRTDSVRVGYNLPNITNILAPVVPETSMAGLTPVTAQGFNRKLDLTSWGLYAQDQIEIGEQIKVRAGLRGDRVRARDVGAEGVNPFRDITVNDTLISGSFGAVWQPTRDLSIYAGYSSGAFVNLATEATKISAEPEKASQKEIGIKTTFLDGRADVNASLFHSQRNNYFIALVPGGNQTPDGNDRTRGIDMDLNVRPIPGLSISASWVIQNAETTTNASANNPALGITASIAGKRPAGVARQNGRLWSAYEFQDAALKGWGFGLGMTYKSDSYADSLNLYRVPSYTIFDAAIFYRTKQWDASLNLGNLTDRTYYVSPTFSGALPGDPRSAMLTLRYRFN